MTQVVLAQRRRILSRRHDIPSCRYVHRLRAYRADPASGSLTDCRVLHSFPEGRGRPDGGSFDALYDGGRVVRLSPAVDIVDTVVLPVPRPTMIAFGGEDRRTAYVTTARTPLDAEGNTVPLSGAIFSFRVDVPGVPERDFG